MTIQELPDVLTVPQAAAYLQTTNQTVYKLIDQGELASFRLGRLLRIRKVDLETFLETRSMIVYAPTPPEPVKEPEAEQLPLFKTRGRKG